MKNFTFIDRPQIDCLTFNHCICTRIAVKAKGPLPFFIELNEGQRCFITGIDHHIFRINALTLELFIQKLTEDIVADLTDKACLYAMLYRSHRQICGSSAWVAFKYDISIFTDADRRKINQGFTK